MTEVSSRTRIGTHDGTFHADEVVACALLTFLPEYSNAEITRTRDEKLLSTCDVVVDVGGIFDSKLKRFDHHQREFNLTFKDFFSNSKWDIKLSSAGLVYVTFGHRILSSIIGKEDEKLTNALFFKLYSAFLVELDAIDNGVSMTDGVPRFNINTSLSSRIKRMNRACNHGESNEMEIFQTALTLAKKEFLDVVDYYHSVWYPGREIVLEAIKRRYEVDTSGQIISLGCSNCPWIDHLFDIEDCEDKEMSNLRDLNACANHKLLFCIYKRKDDTWGIQAIPKDRNLIFSQRLPLPHSWRGLRDDHLSEVVGIPGCIFVHSTGFLGVHKSCEGVIHMAKTTMKLAGLCD